MQDPERVRARIDERLALERIAPIDLPILVMGRDDDHLQGIFRVSYDLLVAACKQATWALWNHPLHGYIFPEACLDGTPQVDDIQERAIDGIIESRTVTSVEKDRPAASVTRIHLDGRGVYVDGVLREPPLRGSGSG